MVLECADKDVKAGSYEVKNRAYFCRVKLTHHGLHRVNNMLAKIITSVLNEILIDVYKKQVLKQEMFTNYHDKPKIKILLPALLIRAASTLFLVSTCSHSNTVFGYQNQVKI